MTFLRKLKGDGAALPPLQAGRAIALAWLGGFLAIAAVAMAVGTAISIMMVTRTAHPPAGSNPVIIYLLQPGWNFLLFPTLGGAVILIAVALVYNNATREAAYPKYW